jgi:hypothetical protein
MLEMWTKKRVDLIEDLVKTITNLPGGSGHLNDWKRGRIKWKSLNQERDTEKEATGKSPNNREHSRKATGATAAKAGTWDASALEGEGGSSEKKTRKRKKTNNTTKKDEGKATGPAKAKAGMSDALTSDSEGSCWEETNKKRKKRRTKP